MLTPISGAEWNFEMAAHLLNRAGFGGTPEEIDRIRKAGAAQAVDSLLSFPPRSSNPPAPEWTRPNPERFRRYREMREASAEEKRKLRRAEQRLQKEHLLELKAWWLERMALGPHPLQEKLALFWHGHFATSAQKVKSAYFMWRQNELFRRHGAGGWLKLLTEVSKDPAMLIWLDQARSRKEHPNENFAREVMELFTLGEGHYSERDVSEAARAFTGWSLDRLNGEFIERPRAHDPETKTVLGKSGNFDGEDVLRIITDDPRSSVFITRKLWTFFAAPNPSAELVKALAARFRASGGEFKPLLRAIFLSEEFYSPAVMRQQVKSPVQWLVGTVKLLERPLPPPQLTVGALRNLGQDLFMPPNVKGWDGGLSWITTNNLLHRYNYAHFLVLGEGPSGMRVKRRMERKRPRVASLFPRELWENKENLLSALEMRFLQAALGPEQRSTLRAYLDAQAELDESDLLHAIRLVLSTPDYQLA